MVQELFAYFFGIYIKFATTLDTQVNKKCWWFQDEIKECINKLEQFNSINILALLVCRGKMHKGGIYQFSIRWIHCSVPEGDMHF